MTHATVWAIGTLAPRLLPYPVAWVLALRPAQTPGSVQRLTRSLTDSGATQLELAPLEQTAIDAIAADVWGGAPEPSLQELLSGAAGNPFLGLELINALLDDQAVAVENGVARLIRTGSPSGFQASVRDKFVRLTPETLQFLEAGSVFGRSFTLGDVAAARHVPPGTLIPSANEALNVTILEDRDGRLQFRHDLLRQAIAENIPSSTRGALHREAAAAILGREGSPVEAAAHLVEYAEAGDQQAISVLQQAAGSVAATAPRSAADLMLRAVELMPPGQPGWLESVIATVGLLGWATRFNEANTLAARVLAGQLDPMADGRVRLGVSDTLLLAARRVDLIDQAEEALARPDLPDEVRGHFLHNLAQGLGQDGQVDAAERAFQASLTSIPPENRPLALSCQIGLGLMTAFRGHLVEGLEMANASVAACDIAGPEAQQRMPLLSKAAILAALDRFDEATATLEESKRLADRLGAAWALEFTQRIAVANCWYQGNLADAVAEAEAVLAMAEALDLWHDTDVPLGVLGLAAFHRNDLAGAAAQVRRALDSGSRYSQSSPLLRWAYVEALIIDARGSPVDAIDGLSDVYDRPDALVAALAMDGSLAPALVRLALRANDRARANRVVGASGSLARLNPRSAVHTASAHHSLGLLDNGTDELVRAANGFRDSRRLLAKASAFEDAGRVLAESDDDRGAPLLVEAFEVYSQAGATRDEARVLRRLRDAGIHRRPKTAAARATTGWESLTAAELRVVGLVSEGLTNRRVAEQLFLSPYTVGTHLKHVFTKLDVTSRAELARLAALHETSPAR